jgi:Zn ribbon nucleic-acid-binding protein
MAYPKMNPCPTCQSDDDLAVYVYDSGWHHVECNECWYLGPGEGSTAAAIKAHNEKCTPPRHAIAADSPR